MGSVAVAPRLQGKAQQLWCSDLFTLHHVDLPRSGIESVSPALAGGFLTTEPPRKPRKSLFKKRERESRTLKNIKEDPYTGSITNAIIENQVVTSYLKLQVTSLWGNFPCWNFASHFFSSPISLPEASCSQILVAQSCMPGTQNLRGFTWLTKNPQPEAIWFLSQGQYKTVKIFPL